MFDVRDWILVRAMVRDYEIAKQRVADMREVAFNVLHIQYKCKFVSELSC